VVEGAPLDLIMAVAWLAFLAGTFYFLLAMHAALDISAPRYTSFTIVNGTISEPASQDLTFGITLSSEGRKGPEHWHYMDDRCDSCPRRHFARGACVCPPSRQES
jgi:hypothetical protein